MYKQTVTEKRLEISGCFLFVCCYCFVLFFCLFVFFVLFFCLFGFSVFGLFSDIQYSFSKRRDHSIRNPEIIPFKTQRSCPFKIQRSFYAKYRDHSIQITEIIPFKMQRSFHLKHLCQYHHHFQTCLESPGL